MQVFYYIVCGCAVFCLLFCGNFRGFTEYIRGAHRRFKRFDSAGKSSAKKTRKNIAAAAFGKRGVPTNIKRCARSVRDYADRAFQQNRYVIPLCKLFCKVNGRGLNFFNAFICKAGKLFQMRGYDNVAFFVAAENFNAELCKTVKRVRVDYKRSAIIFKQSFYCAVKPFAYPSPHSDSDCPRG